MMANRIKVWLKPPDQMDLWLAAQGYYRKHTARDGTCLFRAVSEQLFLTQTFHLEIRRQCIEYGLLYKSLFEKMTTSSVEDCLERLRCPSEGGGYLELHIISKMYRCDFILFQEVGKPPIYGTNNGYAKKISLCIVQERHYDSVYTKERIANTAFCQSVIYETLYKDVFGLQEVDYAVKKMLRDKSSRCPREQNNCFIQNGMDLRLEMRDNCTNVKELLNLGVTPFPYKVAKSLDPEIYRNVEYDTWNEYRKGLRYVKKVWNSHELGPGARCLVKSDDEKVFHAFVQEMEPNKGPVLVFIEELGEKRTVPYESLELIPLPVVQPNPVTPVKHNNNIRQFQTAKVAPVQQQPESTSSGKKNFKNCNKIKPNQITELKRRNEVNIDGINENNLTSVAVISSSDYQDDYQLHHEVSDNYQNQAYVTQSCEVTSSVSEIEENIKIESQHQLSSQVVQPPCPPNTLYSINGSPDPNNNYHPNSVPSYGGVNVVPHRSMLPDGSDLPLTDISAVRYFYNLGLDYYMRSNYVMRPEISANGPCYPVIQSPTQYITEHQHISYVNFPYEPSQQQPVHKSNQLAITASDGIPATSFVPSRELVPSPGVCSVSSETSSSNRSVTHHPVSNSSSSHHVAPRFKNKRKLHNYSSNSYHHINNRVTPRDSPSVNNDNNYHHNNGKYHGVPLLQQSDVSTTCPSPVAPVPPTFPITVPPPPPPTIPPALPAPLPPPPSNHYVPIQPSYSPPGAPPTAYYFQPVEYDSYCPVTVGSFIEYSVIDPTPPSGIYPTVISQGPATTQFAPTPYVTTDGVYYQPIVPSSPM